MYVMMPRSLIGIRVITYCLQKILQSVPARVSSFRLHIIIISIHLFSIKQFRAMRLQIKNSSIVVVPENIYFKGRSAFIVYYSNVHKTVAHFQILLLDSKDSHRN